MRKIKVGDFIRPVKDAIYALGIPCLYRDNFYKVRSIEENSFFIVHTDPILIMGKPYTYSKSRFEDKPYELSELEQLIWGFYEV